MAKKNITGNGENNQYEKIKQWFNNHSNEKSNNNVEPRFKLFSSVDESSYSSPIGQYIVQEIEIFKKIYKEYFNLTKREIKIIDSTAHIGVDSTILAYSFPNSRVLAIERNPDTFKHLTKNIHNLGYNQITPIQDSSINVLEEIKGMNKKVDVIFMDPPWGGKGYKSMDDLPFLYPDGSHHRFMSQVVNEIAIYISKIVIVKVPYNFKLNKFSKKIKNGKMLGPPVNIKYLKTGKKRKVAYKFAIFGQQ